MKDSLYHTMAQVEADHWWFVGRRRIVAEVLRRHVPAGGRRVLEIGCGTGGNFALLGRWGPVTAVECDTTALGYARARGGAEILEGALPDAVPCTPGAWDLVVMLDVLEHVADDLGALVAVHELLAPGGRLLLTVPAQPWLWSEHDAAHHHQRRYTAGDLRLKAGVVGLHVDVLSPFNVIFLPVVAAVRGLARLGGRRPESDLAVPPAPLNRALAAVFASERHLVGRVPLPPGVSLLLLASREPSP